MIPRARRVKPVSCRPTGVPRSGNGNDGWGEVLFDGFRFEAALMRPGVGTGVRTVVLFWSAETAFGVVAVAALRVDVIAGWNEAVPCSDDAEEALVPLETPPPRGSMGRMPDRRKASPITAAIVLATRTDRMI